MRQLSASLLALALGAAAAMALVSCGGGNDADLLPGGTASEITANLDMVRELADSGDCAGAQDAAQQVSDQIEALGGVDKRLKQALLDGAARLNEVVASCVETTTPSVAPASIPETTESTVESSEEKEKKEKEKKPKKTEAPPVTPTTPADTTTPTTPIPPEPAPVPPADGGGTGAPGGVSPGDAVDEDE
jgi:septal ring-binding cell division protein DamX